MRQFVIYRIGAIALLFLFLSYAIAQDDPVFTPVAQQSNVELFPYLEYLEDVGGKLSIDDVSHECDGQFKPLRDLKTPGYTRNVYWLKFSANFADLRENVFFIKKKYSQVGTLAVYYPLSRGAGYTSTNVEYGVAPLANSLSTRDYLFEIPRPASTTTYFIKYDPHTNILRPDFVWLSVKGAVHDVHNAQTWSGIFFGGLLILLFYNTVLFSYTRIEAYLYYIYYLSCCIITFYNLTGYSILFKLTQNITSQLFAMCMYALLHGITLFVRSFLNLKVHLPKMDIYLKHVKWLLLLGTITAPWMSVGSAYQCSVLASLIVIPSVFATALLRWRRNDTPAIIFFIGWVPLVMATTVYCLQLMGVFSLETDTLVVLQGATLWEVALFSLAYQVKLADNRAKDANNAFLGVIGHELRTPLQSITASTDVLLTSNLSEEDAKIVKDLNTSVTLLEAHLQDLTSYARMDAGKLELYPAYFDIFELAQQVVDQLSPKLHQKALMFQLQRIGTATEIVTDPNKVRQILNNLLTNAIKYTKRGGITLTLGVIEETNPILNIVVQDTGIGIAPSQIDTVLEPFTQIDQSNTRPNDGAGLGLAIVNGLVSLFKGKLTVESVSGKGSTFRITIPVQLPEHRCAEVPSLSPAKDDNFRDRRVLIVGDQESVRLSVQRLCRTFGMNSDTSINAEDALSYLRSQCYDVILSDIQMPGKDGIVLASEIRSVTGPNQSTPIVAISAYSFENLKDKAYLFSACLRKPVRSEQLQVVLAEILNPSTKLY